MVKQGKSETSAILKNEVKIVDGDISLETTVLLLPIRRIYKTGSEIVDDGYLLHEMFEDELEA